MISAPEPHVVRAIKTHFSAACSLNPLLPLEQEQMAMRFLHGHVRDLRHLRDLLLRRSVELLERVIGILLDEPCLSEDCASIVRRRPFQMAFFTTLDMYVPGDLAATLSLRRPDVSMNVCIYVHT